MHPLDLYEACVQHPPLLAAFLRRVHAHHPRSLREDFCGSAALCREWVRSDPDPSSRALGVDADPAAILAATDRLARLNPDARSRVELLLADALDPRQADPSIPPDVIFVGNFSLGEIHDRPSLVRYLAASRARLAPRGVFVCDTFGGASAFRRGAIRRIHPLPPPAPPTESGLASPAVPSPHPAPNTRIHYTWEQRHADPFHARVTCALHFRVETGGDITHEYTDAFVYHWRLWSVPELRDAMHEAGFARTEVYLDLEAPPVTDDGPSDQADETPAPTTFPSDVADGFIACIVGRE